MAEIDRRPRRPVRLESWLGLLCLAELVDLITTRVDRLRGGVEADSISALALAFGGPVFFWTLKLALVLAMAGAVALAIHYARTFPGRRAAIMHAFTIRALQLCVLVLTGASLNNLAVLLWSANGL